MKLLVGLGNPGSKYARHRHNVGFMALDEIIARNDFSPARKRFQAECAEGRIGGEQVLAIKPQTFMNESGRAVSQAARYYKASADDIIVLHDEIDLAAGKVRVKRGGGLAGHNGLKSIAAHLGADFVRVRIGIGHPGDKARVHRHVLGDFAKADTDWLTPLLGALADNAEKLVAGDHANFMNAVAGSGQQAPDPRAAGSAPPTPVSRPKLQTAKGGKRSPTSQQQLARQAAAADSKRNAKSKSADAGQAAEYGAGKAPASSGQGTQAAQGPFAALRRLLRGGREPGQS